MAPEELVADHGEKGYRNARRPGRLGRFAYNASDLAFGWSLLMIAYTCRSLPVRR